MNPGSELLLDNSSLLTAAILLCIRTPEHGEPSKWLLLVYYWLLMILLLLYIITNIIIIILIMGRGGWGLWWGRDMI